MKLTQKMAIGGIICVLLFLLSITVYGSLFKIRPENVKGRTFDVPEGVSLSWIADKLESQGFIRSRTLFIAASKILLSEKKIMAGEYIFPADMNLFGIISAFRDGKVNFRKVTIPAGYTADQIGRLLDMEGIVSAEDFRAAVRDTGLISSLNLDDVSTLEGFLYPDTYYFLKSESPEKIVRRMVERFREVFTPQLRERAAEFNMTVEEVVTLASMVEKEAAIKREKPIIAAVFFNRLKRNMPLQSDPTVIYALGKKFKGNLRKRHLRIKSPYNTYRIRGLPPGPICNPDIESIKAVLYPADIDYLYFVAKNDGTHYFSRTLREHNRAVYRYQKKVALRRISR